MLKKSRLNKKVLTAMIMATLCSSSAYAMPTGGTVVSGNVTNVANPAELMTANANSIINWDSFSIAVGEKVSFDTRNFMVLNRVVGGQESQLLGMLSDQGNGKLILINPNGIVIGDNAIINVNDLTLSTLSLTNSNFQKLINGETVEFSEVKDGKISIGSNANLTLGEALRLYGGKITIADGVEIVSKENADTNIQMIASNEVVTNFKNSTLSYVGADKSIEIGKATIGTMNNSVSNVDIRADKLSLDGTSIVVNGKDNKVHDIFISGNDANIKNSSLLNRKGKIIAVGPYTWHVWYDSNGNIDKFELDTEPGNQITIKDSLVNTVYDDITVLGANVTLEGAKINSGKDIFVGAVKQYNSEKGVTTATSHDTSTLKADENTVINARGYAEAYGKILDIKARKFDNVVMADNPFIKVLNDQGLTLDKLADILKEHPEYEDVISDILNTKYQIIIKNDDNDMDASDLGKLLMKQHDNMINGIVDEDLDALIKKLQDDLNEESKRKELNEQIDKIDRKIENQKYAKDNKENKNDEKKLLAEKKLTKELQKANKKLESDPGKSFDVFKNIRDEQIRKGIKNNIDNVLFDEAINKDEIKNALSDMFFKAVKDSMDNATKTGFEIKDLQGRLFQSGDTSVWIDGKKYSIDATFTGESGALFMDATVKVDKKPYGVRMVYAPLESQKTFMESARSYGEEKCMKVITGCISDTTKLINALVEPKEALNLWKQCGGEDIANLIYEQSQENFKNKASKVQYMISEIVIAVVPNAGDLIDAIVNGKS